jgi:multicomponent Na+:H+ antiporter subunit C
MHLTFAITAALVFCLSLYALSRSPVLLRKIMALNVMASAVFLMLGSLSRRGADGTADPVPQAMVITGIVVAVAVTAFAVALALRIESASGHRRLPEEREER